MKTLCLILSLLFSFHVSPCFAEENAVVVSIKPLHSLVAGVMGNTGTPVLLVEGSQSPHGFQLKPSQMTAVQHAEIVFFIDESFETFLKNPLQNAPTGLHKIAMANQPAIHLLHPRTSATWLPHVHATQDNTRTVFDAHLWLDISNAKAMVAIIAQELSALYPQNKSTYAKNAASMLAKLAALDSQLAAQLQPVKNTPYIVFHDAFQYVEYSYGLASVGAITLEPEQPPSARRIAQVREKLRTSHVNCVFSEPQFDIRLIQTTREGTPAKTHILDEHGADITAGPELYFTLMKNIADGFAGCLG